MHWVAWLLIANICVCYTEYQYRCGDYATFWQALPFIALPIVLAQWSLFEGFRAAPSLFAAGAVLASATFYLGSATHLC